LKRVAVFAVIFIVLLVVLITFLTLSRRKVTDRLVLSGVVESVQHDLSFRMPGLITQINCDEGDFIDSGAVIAVLDSNEVVASVDQVQKSYLATKANIGQLNVQLSMVNRNLNKVKELLKTGAANQTQFDDLSDQKRQLQAQLEYASKNLESQQALVDLASIRKGYTVLTSPIKGKIISRQYEPGEVAVTGSPVVSIADLDNLTIKVYLPEIYLGRVQLGKEIAIEIDSHPGKTFPGKITFISDKAEFTPKNVQTKEERVKQVFAIKIACNSQGGTLKPGLPCDVIIPLNQ
jgi:HlyD family secretion protein